MQNINVKYFTGVLPLTHVPGGDWVDVRAAEDIYLTGRQQLIPLGFALELPEGYEAYLICRSSTFKKYGIIQTNGMGIIDESYNGDNDQWFLPVLQVAFNVESIPKNTRIAQFRIVKKQPDLVFNTVHTLGNTDRGGHGSTGEI